MREIGRQRRLRRLVTMGLAAMVALGVGGSVAATQAQAASTRPAAPGLSISKQFFGFAFDKYAGHNLPVFRYTLRNNSGMRSRSSPTARSSRTSGSPDRNGARPTWCSASRPWPTTSSSTARRWPPTTGVYFGETVGRYANRIANGKFTLNQPGVGPVTYTIPVNNGPNALHGGIVGFGNHVWASQPVFGLGSVGVRLTLISPNGDEGYPAGSPGCPNGCTGYPATIKVVVTYTLNNANQLAIHYTTTNLSTNLNTVLNLTNHSYFNLAGESSFPGSAYGQIITINANKYTPTNTTSIPLGYLASVFGTPMNFTTPFAMGARIQDVSANFNSPGFNQLLEAQGYDHNWVLNRGPRPLPARSGSTWPPPPPTRAAAGRSPSGLTSPASSSTPATS